METVQSILEKNPCYKAGKKIKVSGLMLHSVGCPLTSAETFVKKWNNAESSRACVHAFIDGNTGKVYQTLPWDHRAWHCGSDANGSANNTHIGVEMCEPACIKYTGGATFTCSDRETALAVVKRTYAAAVELFAFLCRKFELDPLADGVIISHKEGHDRKIASGHGDPEHLWNGLSCGYTMAGFRQAVREAMGTEAAAGEPAEQVLAKNAPESTGDDIREGTVVRLADNAVYYTGKEMPDWVKRDTWIVKSVSGTRAVIDKNADGTRNINSPVDVKYLTVVSDTVQEGTAPQVPPTPASLSEAPPSEEPLAPATLEMQVSDRGVALVAQFEGCKLEAYRCPAGVLTIGYGHTAGVKEGDRLPSQEAAKALLKEDLAKYGGYVNDCVKDKSISFALTQNQFDALTDFCYNCGKGSLKKLVEGRDAATVAEKLLAYNKAGGKVLAGLTRRREAERALFLSQE
ncbi:MAG: N-acetylmuramoyl-L-alanine amidase [Roseburia sp.]|nr:N-acetylmuramoyl-L-alanine amidase [Roseburia sp.]